MHTMIIGIAGGTGSGKTTLTDHLAAHFGPAISVVHHDNYYKRQDVPFEVRCQQNYDHPDAFDTDLMIQQLKELKAGRTIRCPVYSYADHNRTDETVLIRPAPVIIVEGILIFHDPRLRQLMDIRIFVETDADVRILRRALAAFFLLPLAIGAHHIGMFFPAAVLGVLAWMLLRPQKLKMLLTGKGRILWRSLLALFAAGLLCVAVILGLMARQAADRPEAVGPCTVLVLGCEVRGLRPSKMLAARIDSAYDYLTANPEAVCVACGGMADDEIITEARCIRDELVRRGIDPGRIYLEEKSLNTRQNISYAADIIRAKGLPTEVAVASDNFHQLRAAVYARGSGLEAQSLGCRSYWLLGPGYWAREVIAVAAAWAFGR